MSGGEEEVEIKPDMTKLEKVNAIVSKAGLYWNGHYHLACVRLTFTLSNGCGVDAEFNPSHCNYRTLIDGVFGIDSEDGSILSTYNPMSKWDWYEIGGRWRGGIPGNEVKMSEVNIDTIDTPYAFVTTDGEWVERGQMGWFGISSNEMNEDEWDAKFREYLKTLDKDIILTLVDCHI